ncbi:beta-glucanase [Shouchella miscanthi]|uniref:beta-glucanase n=1 Tax=Shouchella miscanthi TaxID=2598861 RepID=UPI003F5A5329
MIRMKHYFVSLFFIFCCFLLLPPTNATAQQQGLFTVFNQHDQHYWQMSNGWRNNDPFFGCHWRADRVNFPNGQLELSIRSNTSLPAPYSYECAEYTTHDFYGYGLYEVSMKPSNVSGMISSFFTYTGPSYNGDPWDEIDIEFLGKDTTKVQFNYYTNGVGNNEILHDLGFDASQDFHTYAFDWQPHSITWYVNGEPIATRTENIPTTPGKIMMNLWNTYGIDEWAGRYTGEATQATYEWVRYTPSTSALDANAN